MHILHDDFALSFNFVFLVSVIVSLFNLRLTPCANCVFLSKRTAKLGDKIKAKSIIL